MRGRREVAAALLLGLLALPVFALDCEPRRPDAMPCCQETPSTPCHEMGAALACCSASPAGPEGNAPALRVASPAPAALALPVALPVTPTPAPALVLSAAPDPADSSPPRPLVLRL